MVRLSPCVFLGRVPPSVLLVCFVGLDVTVRLVGMGSTVRFVGLLVTVRFVGLGPRTRGDRDREHVKTVTANTWRP